MFKLETLIEITKLEKENRGIRLQDKLKEQEYYGDKEDLFDRLTKALNSNGEAWRTHSETMQALPNQSLAALADDTS